MQVFKTVNEIQNCLKENKEKSIGFVATMGALHQGHISLIDVSKKENQLTVCSIFVNPKQFNKKEDLNKYPRNIALDLKKLEKASCDLVFIPSVEEMYPIINKKEYQFGLLSEVMEGKHRPEHFNGVAIVIKRFFDILKPTRAYFGEKDFQQLAIIRVLAKQIKSNTKIIGCPIYREKNGLAMSSRNERLSEKEKELASEISKTLIFISQHKHNHSVSEFKIYFKNTISQHKLLSLEYFEIANKLTLKPIQNWSEAKECMAFAAVNIGGVRLIDNITIIN